MAVWNQRYPEGNPWHYSGIREFRRDSHAPFASFALTEQRLCSNPSKSPEMLGNTPTQKCGDFQQFCKLWKPLENQLGALAWRRTRVRVSSGPLRKGSVLQVKCRERITGSRGIRPLYIYRAATRVSASICRHFVRSRDVQQPITLPSHGRGRWFGPSIVHSENCSVCR